MDKKDSKPSFEVSDLEVQRLLKPDLNYDKISDIANEIISIFQKNDLSYNEAEMVLRVTQVFIGKCKIVF